LRLHVDVQDPGAAHDDAVERVVVEEIEPVHRAESIAQWRAESPDARRRSDEREAWQRQSQGPRARCLAEDDVEMELLPRRIALLIARLRRRETFLHAVAAARRSSIIVFTPRSTRSRGAKSSLLPSRSLTSASPFSIVRRLTMTRIGRPIRSASANFTPAESSRSSYRTSTPACSNSAYSWSAAARTRSSVCGSVSRCTWNGATAIGQMMPLSS